VLSRNRSKSRRFVMCAPKSKQARKGRNLPECGPIACRGWVERLYGCACDDAAGFLPKLVAFAKKMPLGIGARPLATQQLILEPSGSFAR
jgi:hypothetical protein